LIPWLKCLLSDLIKYSTGWAPPTKKSKCVICYYEFVLKPRRPISQRLIIGRYRGFIKNETTHFITAEIDFRKQRSNCIRK